MSGEKLVSWFKGAVSDRAQTIDFVLPRMALTFVDPRHPDRLWGSCHAMAALALAEGHKQGMAPTDLRIKMFATMEDQLLHTIITDNDGEVCFDSLGDLPGHHYDHQNRTYIAPGHLATKLVMDMGFEDFLKNYVSRVTAGVKPPRNEPA